MLIISEDEINDLLAIVNVIPITSKKEGRTIYPNETALSAGSCGLEKESIALCHQIRTIDKKRLSKNYGQISDKMLREEIIAALCFQLGIDR